MLDHNTLSLLKPKRLYEDKSCIIHNNMIKIDFGATQVVAPFQSKLPTVEIAIKDLWSGDLDAAKPCESKEISIPKFDKWNEIVISAADVTVFSSISSVGEDTFWAGRIVSDRTKLDVEACGLTWYLFNNSPKICLSNGNLDTFVDWNLFYYLFQMFKELSGKKLGTLLWQEDSTNVYFTTPGYDYFVCCNKANPNLQFRSKNLGVIRQYFTSVEGTNARSWTKKDVQAMTTIAETKHLLRPLGDTLMLTDSFQYFKRFASGGYTLYVTKEKVK